MDQSTNRNLRLFKGIKRFSIGIRRWAYILLAAAMIGFSNAFYDETNMLNNLRGFIQQEQVMEEEDEIE